MGEVKIYILCSFFCLFSWNLCFCEIIMFKSGKRIEGKIIEQTDKYIKLDIQGTEVIYLNDEIAAINQSDLGGPQQIELLYKAYTDTLNTPKKQKEGSSKEIFIPAQSVATPVRQTASSNAPVSDLSEPSMDYQEIVKSIIANLQVSQSREDQSQDGVVKPLSQVNSDGQTASSNAPVSDLSKVPTDYQEMVKTAMANLQHLKLKQAQPKKNNVLSQGGSEPANQDSDSQVDPVAMPISHSSKVSTGY